MERNDEQLIADYLLGDEDALSLLIQKNLTPVYAFVFHMVKNEGDAADITQEVFLKVWKNLRKYREGTPFRVWLFRIARNTTIDHLRKRKEFVFSDFENDAGENVLIETLADTNVLQDERFAQRQDAEDMERIIRKLPASYREVILLRNESNLTFDEIGQILGKPLNTVKSQHLRALAMLRKLINAPK